MDLPQIGTNRALVLFLRRADHQLEPNRYRVSPRPTPRITLNALLPHCENRFLILSQL